MTRDEELAKLIEEQRKDDLNFMVRHEGRGSISLDARNGDGFSFDSLFGRTMDGELVTFLRPRRGEILNGGASYHGTESGYRNQGCRCGRCRQAHSDATSKRAKRRRRNRPNLPCPVCAAPYLPFGTRQYCSPQCSAVARLRRRKGIAVSDPTRECLGCGATFTTRQTRQVYCSPSCGQKHYRSRQAILAA